MKSSILVFSNLGANSYKSYRIELRDDGTVISKFSAVGKTEQSCNYGQVGEAFYEKKIREKVKKGYQHAKVIGTEIGSSQTAQIARGSLADIAVSQIQFGNDAIQALIRRLADSNVHKICAATNIVFNANSGVFQTPLGVVSQEGLDEARTLLSFFANLPPVNASYKKNLDAYLRLIPRVKSHKMRYEDIFPTQDTVQKESDVLDALESSLGVVSSPAAPVAGTPAPVAEKVFDLRLDVLNDVAARERISKWFYSSNHRTHGYSNVKINEIYEIAQPSVPFNEKMGNLKELFHGTSEANVLSCLKGGLRTSPPSTAAIAGKMWGNGVYGALDSSKSLQYSFGRFAGSGGSSAYLFVADFALGRLEIPRRSSGGPNRSQYDSVWAQTQNTGLRFDEVIVFNDSQVKIKYLITAK